MKDADEPSSRVREDGSVVAFAELRLFLGVTNRWNAAVRAALSRTHLGAMDTRASDPIGNVDAQSVFDHAVMRWGWRTEEEVTISLAELGLEIEGLGENAEAEALAARRVLVAARREDPPWVSSVLSALFLDDLSLKREAMRFGALRYFSRNANEQREDSVTLGELYEAKRACCNGHPGARWVDILEENALDEQETSPILTLIARARRQSVPLLARMASARMAPASTVTARERARAWIGAAPKPEGELVRAAREIDADAVASRLVGVLGITKVLAPLPLAGVFHAAVAYRESLWARQSGSGKGLTTRTAFVGAIFEEAEKYAQEKFAPSTVLGSYEELARKGRVVDPCFLPLPWDTRHAPAAEIRWATAMDLFTGDSMLIPEGGVVIRRGDSDVLYSETLRKKLLDTNGLASGMNLADAIMHGLAEAIERHARRLADIVISNPGGLPDSPVSYSFVDVESTPASSRKLIDALRSEGFRVRILDITSEVRVPTFEVRAFHYEPLEGLKESYAFGAGCHPRSEIALNRALLEAAQQHIGAEMERAGESSGARSLGQSRRPKPLSKGDALWFKEHVPVRSLESIGSITNDVTDDIDTMLEALSAAGFDQALVCDLSVPELAPLRVVRIVVPGAESIHPMHTGPRARALLISDLSQTHM